MNKLVMTVVASSLLALISNAALATEQVAQPAPANTATPAAATTAPAPATTTAPAPATATTPAPATTTTPAPATTTTPAPATTTAPAPATTTAPAPATTTAPAPTPAENDASTTTPVTTAPSGDSNTTAPAVMPTNTDDNAATPATPSNNDDAQTTPATTTEQPQSSLPWNGQKTAAATINCQYILPASQKNFTQAEIQSWANFASAASFTYDYKNYQAEFDKLKPCYTANGWKSFNQALTKSGNLKVVQKEKLSVNATAGKPVTISKVETADQPNTWNVTLPIAVTYKGDQVSAEQNLQVTLRLTQTTNADGKAIIGIEQLVASPEKSDKTTSSSDTAKEDATTTPTADKQ